MCRRGEEVGLSEVVMVGEREREREINRKRERGGGGGYVT